MQEFSTRKWNAVSYKCKIWAVGSEIRLQTEVQKESGKTIGKSLKEVGKIICGGRKSGNARTCGHMGKRKSI